jgi:hypothetical protein
VSNLPQPPVFSSTIARSSLSPPALALPIVVSIPLD